mgnify:CR=1 FL=1
MVLVPVQEVTQSNKQVPLIIPQSRLAYNVEPEQQQRDPNLVDTNRPIFLDILYFRLLLQLLHGSRTETGRITINDS